MPADRDPIDIHFNALRKLRALSLKLGGLALSFHDTGNVIMYDTLVEYADIADKLADRFDDAFTLLSNSYFQSTRESTMNMLGAALAVIGQKNKQKQE